MPRKKELSTYINDSGPFEYPTFGYGKEFVYVYYFKTYQLFAEKNNLDYWPCKIGKTKTSIFSRVNEQQTTMPEKPIIPFVFRTTSSYNLEVFLHFALRNDSREWPSYKNYKGGGTEWYLTNPLEILNIAEKYGQTGTLGKHIESCLKNYKGKSIKSAGDILDLFISSLRNTFKSDDIQQLAADIFSDYFEIVEEEVTT